MPTKTKIVETEKIDVQIIGLLGQYEQRLRVGNSILVGNNVGEEMQWLPIAKAAQADTAKKSWAIFQYRKNGEIRRACGPLRTTKEQALVID
jgi:hypothetical protein